MAHMGHFPVMYKVNGRFMDVFADSGGTDPPVTAHQIGMSGGAGRTVL